MTLNDRGSVGFGLILLSEIWLPRLLLWCSVIEYLLKVLEVVSGEEELHHYVVPDGFIVYHSVWEDTHSVAFPRRPFSSLASCSARVFVG